MRFCYYCQRTSSSDKKRSIITAALLTTVSGLFAQKLVVNEVCKSTYEAPETLHLQVEIEGGFVGSLNETPSGSTAVQDWSYTNNIGDSDTWN